MTARELDRILESVEPRKVAVERAARELRLSTRQVYVYLARYRGERRVSSLLPKIGRERKPRISEEVEAIIAEGLRSLWLKREQPDLAPIVEEIRARCEEKGLHPPAYVTVAKRIPRLFTAEEIARQRHSDARHLRRLKPRPGYFRADHPLDVVQIDHTPADIHFVEVIDGHGVFVARPYMTLAVDVATSAIMGFCLTLDHPSRLSVALCLAHAMSDKTTWLRDRNIDHAWPMHGRPKSVVVDSAKEFRSESFARSCAEYGIVIKFRNRGTVHHGGVVERLLGKINTVLRALPGKTGRSIADRDGYPSQDKAKLNFADLERCVALAIIDHNLGQNARKLTVPLDEWRNRVKGAVGPVDDPVAVLLNFLPRVERRISPQGVSLFAIDYFDPWLGPLVARRDRLAPMELCYDPRDMRAVHLRDPDTGSWRAVARRDGSLEPITLWQHRANRSLRSAEGRKGAQARTSIRREIAATVTQANAPNSRSRTVGTVSAVQNPRPPAATNGRETLDPNRPRRVFPIEDW